ncbi:hypothetical protein SEZ29_004433 [Escherichia coli]|nr:hypothetical protein [Escherichia coli]
MNQVELIDHLEKQAEKAIGSHGIGSDYAMYAMYVLQAALAGSKCPHDVARVELDRLQKIRIDEWFEVV